MPFYTYRCTKCSYETTESRPVAYRDAPMACRAAPSGDLPATAILRECHGSLVRKLEAPQVAVPREHRAAG